MCGRFVISVTWDEARKRFDIKFGSNDPLFNYNVAPSQNIPVVVSTEKGNALELYKWGLVPHWAKDPKIGYKMINARAETVADKPAYRTAFSKHRCLILANGFYEWKNVGAKKVPYFIHLKGKKVFAFAGIASRWTAPGGENLYSCSIITTTPNKIVKSVHDRMPVILQRKNENNWLDPELTEKEKVLKLLKPRSAEEYSAYEVSTIVNSPKNISEDCIKPVGQMKLA